MVRFAVLITVILVPAVLALVTADVDDELLDDSFLILFSGSEDFGLIGILDDDDDVDEDAEVLEPRLGYIFYVTHLTRF